MSIIWVTDANTNNKVAVNTKYVTAIFEPAAEGAPEGTVAVIGMISGVIPVTETVDEIVALIGSDL